MSDFDGVVEMNNKFLILEWKGIGGALTLGQEIMFKKLTESGDRFTVFVVHGNSMTMEVFQYEVFFQGRREKVSANLTQLKERFRAWSMWVMGDVDY